MSDSVLLSDDARAYLERLDEKSRRICRDNLEKLAENPYPGRGTGDKEKLVVDGEELYRLHVGRTHTAFYVILEDEQQVRVVDIVPIDETHKRYGY
jgi:mRNA-degrading endonuclease RelE of RelBE toxin-antitoxin system